MMCSFLWKCILCGGWYSLWKQPTLWEHLEEAHRVTRADIEAGPKDQRVIPMGPFPYQWTQENAE
jgi:hypothetical protein